MDVQIGIDSRPPEDSAGGAWRGSTVSIEDARQKVLSVQVRAGEDALTRQCSSSAPLTLGNRSYLAGQARTAFIPWLVNRAFASRRRSGISFEAKTTIEGI